MSTLFYILPILLVIRIFNNYRVKNLTLETQNKVNELRNELYISAIDGRVPKKHPAFLHIDDMIEFSIPVIERVNIWVYFYKAIFYKNKIVKSSELETELSFSNVQPIKHFFERYANESVKYLGKKNLFSLILAFIVVHISKHLSKKMYSWVASIKANLKYQFLSRTDEFYPTC